MSTNQATLGYVIAYVAPGSVVLWGMSRYSSEIRGWFGVAAEADTSVGGFLFIVLAALALGIFVSGVRWLAIDNLLKLFGITRPDLDYSKLDNADVLSAFDRLNEGFYRFYQFYANMLVALLTSYVMWIADLGVAPWARPAGSVAMLLVCVALLLSASDSLSKYYAAAKKLVGEAT